MKDRWKVTKIALGFAVFTGLLQVLRSAGVFWLGKQTVPGPAWLVVVGEFTAALIIGVVIDLLRSRVRNRWHAMLVGMVAWFPVQIMIYFLLVPERIPVGDLLGAAVIGSIMIGGFGGLVLYSPDG